MNEACVSAGVEEDLDFSAHLLRGACAGFRFSHPATQQVLMRSRFDIIGG